MDITSTHQPDILSQERFLRAFEARQRGDIGDDTLNQLLECAQQVGCAKHPEKGSILGWAITESKEKKDILPIIQALVSGGCDPSDDFIPQRHDRAINLALSSKVHEVSIWLIEQGANPNALVPEWLRRPRTAKHARHIVQFYEAVWPKWNIEMQSRYLSTAVVDLIAAEMMGKCNVSDKLRDELTQKLIQSPEFNSWNLGLVAMDDGLKLTPKDNDRVRLLDGALARWRKALDGDGLSMTPEGLVMAGSFKERIPAAWVAQLGAELPTWRTKDTLEETTPPTKQTRNLARRI